MYGTFKGPFLQCILSRRRSFTQRPSHIGCHHALFRCRYVWELHTGGFLQSFLAHASTINGIALTRGGRELATVCSKDRTMKFWRVFAIRYPVLTPCMCMCACDYGALGQCTHDNTVCWTVRVPVWSLPALCMYASSRLCDLACMLSSDDFISCGNPCVLSRFGDSMVFLCRCGLIY